jgi:hypothetical protein
MSSEIYNPNHKNTDPMTFNFDGTKEQMIGYIKQTLITNGFSFYIDDQNSGILITKDKILNENEIDKFFDDPMPSSKVMLIYLGRVTIEYKNIIKNNYEIYVKTEISHETTPQTNNKGEVLRYASSPNSCLQDHPFSQRIKQIILKNKSFRYIY